MATSQPAPISEEEFRVLLHRAGLDLEEEEVQRLLAQYHDLEGMVARLHDPGLPLAGPASNFSAG